jgi:hypothetical protein
LSRFSFHTHAVLIAILAIVSRHQIFTEKI